MSTLTERLRAATEQTRSPSYQATFLRLPDDADAIAALLDSDPGLLVHDEIREQVRGLLETRNPEGLAADGDMTADDLEALVDAHLGADPDTFGVWAHFPWARRLVHILPEDEYRELRTSRNRNKITLEEQARLRDLHIGIVGLSIGQAAAVTLTLEEVGGTLVLADFDHLELSNMNRLRVGVEGLGVNKAILAAREVAEINPYTRVVLFLEGVSASNLDAFFHGGGRKLDLLFEECDDLRSKFEIREHARRLGVPVLMETSDRGMMDIERFDREPDRPLFHGLTGDVDLQGLDGMSKRDKVPLMLRIIGEQGMSYRMKASMIDIDTTLKSWPQLASEVALGAGVNVDSARRIALGELNDSGRFYVDMHQVIRDGAPPIEPYVPEPARSLPQAHDLPALRPAPSSGPVDDATMRLLAAWATTAFSGGNMQPWTLVHRGDTLSLFHDRARSASILDCDHRASYIAFGSMVEILASVAPAIGLSCQLDLFPDDDPLHVADVTFATGAPVVVDPLVQGIPDRVANRRLGPREPLPPTLRTTLEAEADVHGATLGFVSDPSDLHALSKLVGRADRIRMTHPRLHRELMGEMRWTDEDVHQTRDGIDIDTMELPPPDRAGIGLMSDWTVMETAVGIGGGQGVARSADKPVRTATALVLLSVEGTAPTDFVRAGRALHRVWTRANLEGWSIQPLTPITFLLYRLTQADGRDLAAFARSELEAMLPAFRALYPSWRPASFLFRLAKVGPPSGRSLRRPLDDVLKKG